ncbi:hypothetical protein GRI91_08410 [Altererythrobacter endophyticus]|uniref:Uncharacterized protein n=2 Tax=Altericroceibacterium endophyticum TaxID=1808508 RepID=A0A6I4T3D8_9SPHN|nr:hypothetical protein [Altericroceibacterium endophyticum]
MPGSAQPVSSTSAQAAADAPTFADLATLVDRSDMVIRAQITDQATVEPERSAGLQPGHVRLYLEADTQALLFGSAAVGEKLKYLVDLPLTENGKAPKVKKQSVLLFGKNVAGRPGQFSLVTPDAQLPATPELEATVRKLLGEMTAPDALPRVTGIQDVMSVRGNLAGESETQIFFNTKSGAPVSISVVRRPNMDPRWGVSWSEIVDQSAQPPEPNTMEWYRIACLMPDEIPESAFLQSESAPRYQAQVDYEFVRRDLGECTRNITSS